MVFDACSRYDTTDDDGDSDGFIDWKWVYCNTDNNAFIFIFCAAFVLTIILMNVLGTTADDYFVPVLHTIAYVCRLRADVAGITLLAFGNGAPDIITAVTGIVSAGNFGLVIGNLLGGSNFIFMVIQGAVLQTAHRVDSEKKGYVQLDKGTYLRDMLAYIGFIGLIIAFSATGGLHIWHVAVLLVLYLIYVGVVFKTGASHTGDIFEAHLKHRAVSLARSEQEIDMARMSRSSFASDVSAAKEKVKLYKSALSHSRQRSTDSVSTSFSMLSSNHSKQHHHLVETVSRGSNVDVSNEPEPDELELAARALSDSVASRGIRGLGEGSVTSNTKVSLADLMQESGDALEDLGDKLAGLEAPEHCCCTDLDHALVLTGEEDEGGGDRVGTLGFLGTQVKIVLEWSLYVTEVPFSLGRIVSIPSVDQGWGYKRRIANTVSWPLGLVVTVFGFIDEVDTATWVVALVLGAFIGTLFYFTTEDGEDEQGTRESIRESLIADQPKSGAEAPSSVNAASPMLLDEDRRSTSYWFLPLLLLAFVSSVAWMNVIAAELVNSAISVAVETGTSTSILGLTLVAWGNSIGDYVADVAVCSTGAPFTAICSTVGSPMLSAIIGIALSVTLAIAQSGNFHGHVPCHLTIQVWVSYAFLLIAQLSTLAVALYHDYRLPVKWTYVLWAIYACFLICAISIELSVDEDTG